MSLLCQKRIEVNATIVTYCMKPLNHSGACETPEELGYRKDQQNINKPTLPKKEEILLRNYGPRPDNPRRW
jgi:hypothetical protein